MSTFDKIVTVAALVGLFTAFFRKKTVLPQQGGWLYFIGGTSGPIKVGITREETPEERLKAIQTGNPNRLQVLYATLVRDPETAEGIAHNALADAHVGGEWYGREQALELLHSVRDGV